MDPAEAQDVAETRAEVAERANKIVAQVRPK